MKAGIRGIALTASVIALLMPTSAAAAAEGEIQLSDDGVSFATTYPGVLFDSIAHLVPGDSDTELFYLRNTGDAPGFLRLTLRDVTSTNTDFVQALTVSTSTPQFTGAPVVVGSVNPCWVLLEGQRIEPGETVGVTTNLALGNLDGVAGQGATAGLTIRATLSGTSTGSLAPTDCDATGSDVPVLPPPTPRSATGQGASSVPPVGAATAVPEANSGGVVGDLPVLNLPGGIVIDPNTWHLYEEFLVLILFASAVVGAVWFMLVARRRRHSEGEAEMDVIA